MLFASDYIAAFAASPLARFGKGTPWELTSNASEAVDQLMDLELLLVQAEPQNWVNTAN